MSRLSSLTYYSVCVLVNVRDVLGVDMRVGVGLPVVIVLVFMLHVIVVMQNVRVGMCRVLVCAHGCVVLRSLIAPFSTVPIRDPDSCAR